MLIIRADIYRYGAGDLRIEDGRVKDLKDIGTLQPNPGERVLDARGGALLPGLHDHHFHLMSYAASLDSVRCGPPEVGSEADFIRALHNAAPTENGWIRGVGYHDSVAGDIDRNWLDAHGPSRPIRVQHRSGRLWIFNGLAIDQLPAGIDPRGRLYDQDKQLQAWLPRSEPAVQMASDRLAAHGVTGITDMTPSNTNATAAHFQCLQSQGELRQHVHLAGTPALDTSGPTKIHLHDTALPSFSDLCSIVGTSHTRGRGVAIHCVTEVELVYALAAIREAGPHPRDRIEHASVTPPTLLEQIRELQLTVVTQPNFIAERGDAYRADVPANEHPWLYRAGTFLAAGIPLAGGTDAPFGDPDPWRAMRAAISRETPAGWILGADEALSPEQALDLFLGADHTPATPRQVDVGTRADLCLLDASWTTIRSNPSKDRVRATIRAGEPIYERDSQTISSIKPQANASSAGTGSPRIAIRAVR